MEQEADSECFWSVACSLSFASCLLCDQAVYARPPHRRRRGLNWALVQHLCIFDELQPGVLFGQPDATDCLQGFSQCVAAGSAVYRSLLQSPIFDANAVSLAFSFVHG